MRGINAVCNERCGRNFTVDEFQETKLPKGIRKTSFTCSHCGKEYVAFYTDREIRDLQAKMRRVLASAKMNGKDSLQNLIKDKMQALRNRYESSTV